MLVRILAGALLSLVPFASLALGEAAGGGSPDADGRWWLSQPPSVRQNFVRGWTDGYTGGWLSAQARLLAVVDEARAAVPPERKLAAALLVSVTLLQEADPAYRKAPAHYADQVTTFFNTYADLRDCPVGLVLKGLDGRGALSLEEIARWLRETWPR
ncbi:MAG TPA: hypothetical protein VIG69_05175 [Candidatus Methylomirabilis sp.]|jgi:hypothetical protein